MERNSTSFPLKVYEFLKSKKWSPSHAFLMFQQFLVQEYILGNPKLRGLLGFHGMGTGKTRMGSSIAHKLSWLKRTVLLAPKSVHGQFKDEFKRLGHTGNVQYISLKASNMAAQIEQLDIIPGLDVAPMGDGSLDSSFVIVDEAHNLFNSICNGSKNAIDFYDIVMDAKNIKLLFLSGSPIINDPFELVPCYNMLAGYKLFGESKEEFDRYFVKDGKMINKDKFMNRIAGLTSYYGEKVMPSDMIAKMPTMKPIKVIRIAMSEEQYAVYSTLRDKEHEESKKPMKRAKAERFTIKTSSSSYRIGSRKASNVIPVNNATDEDLLNVKHCPKMHYVLNTIIPEHKNQTGIILSSFVHDCGLADMARLMILKGWERWEEGMVADSSVKRFAVSSGDETLEEREHVRKAFSRKENINGNIIRVLLLGPASVEGTNLKNARWGVQLDPFFNETRLEQGRNRIRRILSHEDWPPEERNIQFYVLLADIPKTITAKEPSTDSYLYVKAKKARGLHHEFFDCMIDASIDCLIHRDALPEDRAKDIHCMMCSPTDRPLYGKKIELDIESENPCKPPAIETITTKEIIIQDSKGEEVKYMYRKGTDGGFEFYRFDPKIGGYILLPRNHPHFDLLIEALS